MNDQTFLDVARTIAKESKCVSLQVGCVIVNENERIIATGINGTPSGFINCCDKFPEGRCEDHHEWSNKHEVYAEMNAILDLARNGTTFKKLTVYVTHSPCSNCLKHLIGLASTKTGVAMDRIVYGERYHRYTKEDIAYLKSFCQEFNVELVELN